MVAPGSPSPDGGALSLAAVSQLSLSTRQTVEEVVLPKLQELRDEITIRDREWWVEMKMREEAHRKEMVARDEKWAEEMKARDEDIKTLLEALQTAKGAIAATQVIGGGIMAVLGLVIAWLTFRGPPSGPGG